MGKSRQGAQTRSTALHGWKLGEAKARFSDVVRLAASGQPQHVTVRGKDTVVIVATSEFERLCARTESVSLHDLLSKSPLNRLDFDAARPEADALVRGAHPSGGRK